MGSIMKMFKPNKKNSNKENQPTVSFATNSLKSKKSQANDTVYAGEPQKMHLELKSPYAVITAPKTTRGPMSCPGAPMDDYKSDRYLGNRQNAARSSSRKVKDDSVLSHRSELVDEQTYRNLMARQQYDMSMSQQYDSDEEDQKYKLKYRAVRNQNEILKAKMEKMKAKLREEKALMSKTIDDVSQENYQLRKNHDRIKHKYNEIKKEFEIEQKRKCEVLKMLHEATAKIEKYEKAGGILDESLNNSSLLMPSYGESAGQEGAGESLALGYPAESFGISMFPVTTTATTVLQNPLQKSLEDDLDAQDEVRVFRNSVESMDDEDEEMTEEEAEELELSSPFEVETARISTKRAIQRAHSDSDIVGNQSQIDTISLAPQEPQLAPPENYHRQKYSRTNSWLKRNSVNPEDDGSSDSSEEERYSLIERQLKKKGSMVKYAPPRTRIHSKYYKRFGKKEITALAEFEYLQDMSTDVSGLQSSPELGQLMGGLGHG